MLAIEGLHHCRSFVMGELLGCLVSFKGSGLICLSHIAKARGTGRCIWLEVTPWAINKDRRNLWISLYNSMEFLVSETFWQDNLVADK